MIPDTLFEALARDYEPPHWSMPQLLREGTAPEQAAIRLAQDSVPAADVASLDHDSIVQSELLFSGDEDQRVRLFIVSREATRLIQNRRLTLAALGAAAPPYGHPALQGLTPDDEGLVPLGAFDIDGDALCRNGFAFFVLPGVPGSNANYWLLNEVQRSGLVDSVKVRLDPLLFGPTDELRGRFYRAAVYGRDLDWDRVRQLRVPEHGRWTPGRLSRGYLFTDYAWIPHDNEVDFHCEELPVESEVAGRGTRYLHAIYNKGANEITHLDGATRILTASEHRTRSVAHVRSVGEIGRRVKIFRTDRAITRETLGPVAEGFFVWNYDVPRHFGAPIHPDL